MQQISLPTQELWISDFVADIPVWSHLLPLNEFLPQLIEGIQPALSSILFSKTSKESNFFFKFILNFFTNFFRT